MNYVTMNSNIYIVIALSKKNVILNIRDVTCLLVEQKYVVFTAGIAFQYWNVI